jgi:hypothetical protein
MRNRLIRTSLYGQALQGLAFVTLSARFAPARTVLDERSTFNARADFDTSECQMLERRQRDSAPRTEGGDGQSPWRALATCSSSASGTWSSPMRR